jgi:hypothetical protein
MAAKAVDTTKRTRSCRNGAEMLAVVLGLHVTGVLMVGGLAGVHLLGIATGGHVLAVIVYSLGGSLMSLGLLIGIAAFLGWLRLVHQDVHLVTEGSHPVTSGVAAGLMLAPLFNLYWLYHTLSLLGRSIWTGCRLHGLPAARPSGIRKLAGTTVGLVVVTLLSLAGAFCIAGRLFSGVPYEFVRPAAAGLSILGLCSWAVANVLLVLSALILSRDVDRLYFRQTSQVPVGGTAVIPAAVPGGAAAAVVRPVKPTGPSTGPAPKR